MCVRGFILIVRVVMLEENKCVVRPVQAALNGVIGSCRKKIVLSV